MYLKFITEVADFYTKNKSIILKTIVLLIIIWQAIGYFPILNFEGDSALFSAGCERLYHNGLSFPPDFFYSWDMQPLTGLLVVGIKYILPFFTCEQIYCVLTIICALSFWILSAFFISNLTKFRWEYCFILLSLLPETYCIGYYPNTAIFASLTFLTGLWLILRKPLNIGSILCLGIAPLFRVDILLIYPVVFFLQLNRTSQLKKSTINTFIYACCTLSISVLLFWSLKANPLNTLNHVEEIGKSRGGHLDIQSFVEMNVTFYTWISLLLILIGIIALIKDKKYILVALSLLPTILLYYIYRDFQGSAAKHIQYQIPFLGIMIVYSLRIISTKISERKYALILLLIILFAGQSFIGIRIHPQSKPWISKPYSKQYSQPTIAELGSVDIKGTKLSFAIGAGQPIATADEIMLISGHFFTPVYYHKLKNTEQEERKYLMQIIKNEKTDTIHFLSTQASFWPFLQILHGKGYYIEEMKPSMYILKNDTKTIIATGTNLMRNTDSINRILDSHIKPFYLYANWDWQQYIINENLTIAQPITKKISRVK